MTCFLFVWLFNFVKYMPFKILVAKLSSPEGRAHLKRTVLSRGFGKSSFRIFKRTVWLLFNPPKVAKYGEDAPDCQLVDLLGLHTSMYELILQSGSMPLVISLGSYS